jgi:RNA 2',3'-cyclic 3'-phosphodiesterase
MRLFVGLPIVDDARREIVALLGRLRQCEWPVRWVHDEGSHLTLKFYGEVAPERLDVIEESVRLAARGTPPLPLRLGALGAFPSVSRPRVLWIGVDAPPELAGLQERLEHAGEAIGFAPEGAPFRPHITLGRVREGQRFPRGGLDEFQGSYKHAEVIIDRLVLYESVLTRQGPRYDARLTLELPA